MSQTLRLIRMLFRWPTGIPSAFGVRLRLFLLRILSKLGRLFKSSKPSRGKDEANTGAPRSQDSDTFFHICPSRVPPSLLSVTGDTPQISEPTKVESTAIASTLLPPTQAKSTPCSAQCSAVTLYKPPEKMLGLSDTIPNLIAVSSTEFDRWGRNVKVPKRDGEIEHIIQPMTTCFPGLDAPDNWRSFVHPEGALYFFDDSRTIPVLTDGYLYDKPISDFIESYIKRIMEYISSYEITLPSQTVLVLEQRENGKCGYYFADHSHQCIFWLDDFDANSFVYEVKTSPTTSHLGQEIRSQYWLHNELFPHVHDVPGEALRELTDILTHAIGDSLTSQSATVPYSLDVVKDMLALVKDIREQDGPTPGSACVIYRLLGTFYHERYLNLHGERAARLNREQSIYPERHRSLFIKIMSPFLLYGPENHLRKLLKISVDSLVNQSSWFQFLQKLTDEWKELTLYATVLLNANVAFLAIQSVDNAATNGHRSNAQRASYFSIVTSIGAIILGLLLVRQHHTTLTPSFLVNRSISGLGLETLSVMYSLPYAFLMWGTLSFLAAFSFTCYSSGDKIVKALISIAWVASCFLLLWTISVSYEDQPYYYIGPVRLWWRFEEFIRQKYNAGRERITRSRNKGHASPA